MNAENRPTCGTCSNFDTNDAKRNPFGTEIQGGCMVNKGVCRAPTGLIFGVMTENTPCKQPPGVYKPKAVSPVPAQ